MRGSDEGTGSLSSYVDREERIPFRHPLRKIRSGVNDVLRSALLQNIYLRRTCPFPV